VRTITQSQRTRQPTGEPDIVVALRVFAPVVVVQAARPTRPAHDGVFQLFAAILLDAVGLALGTKRLVDPRVREARDEAKRWLTERHVGEVTLAEVCAVLDLDPERIAALLNGKGKQRR
jgi:hypothetical protein